MLDNASYCQLVQPKRYTQEVALHPVIIALQPVIIALQPVIIALQPVIFALQPVIIALQPVIDPTNSEISDILGVFHQMGA